MNALEDVQQATKQAANMKQINRSHHEQVRRKDRVLSHVSKVYLTFIPNHTSPEHAVSLPSSHVENNSLLRPRILRFHPLFLLTLIRCYSSPLATQWPVVEEAS